MNFINRAFKNVTRRMSKTILLVLTFFLIGNLVIIGLGVSNASESAKILTRQKMRAVVTYAIDYNKIMQYTENITDEDELNEFYQNYPRIKLADVTELLKDERVKTANALSSLQFYAPSDNSIDFVHLNNRVEDNMNDDNGQSCWILEDGTQQCETYKEPWFFVKANMFPSMIEFEDGDYNIVSGRFYSQQEINDASPVIIVSENFATANGITVGDSITLAVNYLSSYMSQFGVTQQDLETSFEVIGLFSHNKPITPDATNYDYTWPYENPDNMFFMPSTSLYAASVDYAAKQWDYYASLYPDEEYYTDESKRPSLDNMEENLYLENATLLLNDPLEVEQFVLDNQDSISQFTSLDANNEEFNRLAKPLDTLSMYAKFIIWLVVINAIVIITLVTALTLKTREYEIGVLLSIGASKVKVIAQFFLELAIVAIIGFTLSVISGSIIAKRIGNTVLEYQIATSDVNENEDNFTYYYNDLWNSDYSTDITIDDLVAEYDVSVSPIIIAEIYILGLGIVLISVIIPSFMIMRYNPEEDFDESELGGIMSDILRLENINYSYIDGGYERQILKDLSYSFEEGKFYTVLGPSGSGKTTLLSIVAGLDTPNSGEIYFDGKNIKGIGLHKYRRNAISIVFQQYNLISYLTAVENVLLAMSETDNQIPMDKRNVAYNLLERFGIVRSKADRMVGQLSGGEQQRVAIARSLASNVNLIFADEPTGNLDTATEKEIISIFKELSHEFGKTIIVVTHSDTVSAMSDQRVLLKDGKLTQI